MSASAIIAVSATRTSEYCLFRAFALWYFGIAVAIGGRERKPSGTGRLRLMTPKTIESMPDAALLEATTRAVEQENEATADVLALLGEVDARQLYLSEGYSSLFKYCVGGLHLSESTAYHRIQGARAARRFPVILELIKEGKITLTAVALLRSYLTPGNHAGLLAEARFKTKREVEEIVARLSPRRDKLTRLRRLTNHASETDPGPTSGARILPATFTNGDARQQPATAEPPTEHRQPATFTSKPMLATCVPLSPERYRLNVTLSAEAHRNLRKAQDLLQHAHPGADPAIVIERALNCLVERLESIKVAKTERPRLKEPQVGKASKSRRIPAPVKRAVWERDGGRCAFVGNRGRCTETGRLEFHHIVPWALGGASIPGNLSLRCRAHNDYEAVLQFG